MELQLTLSIIEEGTITVPYVAGIGVPGCQLGEVLPLAGSVTGEVMRRHSALIIQTEDRDELKSCFPTRLTAFDIGLRSVIAVPLISRDKMIGAMHFRSTKPNIYSDQNLRLAEGIGSQIAGAVANAQLFTELKLIEERVLKKNALLGAINRVFRETLVCESEEEVARVCLAVAEELTDSKFGFIGEINEAGRFDTIALSDPGWDACRMPKSDALVMIRDMEIRGIWGSALEEERSLITNEPTSHPDRVGLPEGHPPLTSFLGVPLKHAGKTIGLIGLANKELGYDLTEQQAVEMLSVAFMEAMNRKRLEKAREKLIRELEDALSQVKQLKGLLPICMYCKKIRKDKNYWQAIESYVTEHSEAVFSHGVCPECEKKYIQSQLEELDRRGKS